CLLIFTLAPPPLLPLFPTRRSSDLRWRARQLQRSLRQAELQRECERAERAARSVLLRSTAAGPAAAARRADADRPRRGDCDARRSEEHTSELQSRSELVCRLMLEKK